LDFDIFKVGMGVSQLAQATVMGSRFVVNYLTVSLGPSMWAPSGSRQPGRGAGMADAATTGGDGHALKPSFTSLPDAKKSIETRNPF
jgi:hypothetical protein